MDSLAWRIIFWSFVGIAVCSGCERTARKRPFGYVRLGPVRNFLVPETYVRDHNVLVRRDKGGLFAMSTMCTYDLTALKLKRNGTELKLYSTFTDSVYSQSGSVLSGPTTHPLPYYKLKIAPKLAGGTPDTLYLRIGDEVSPRWRLKIPPAALR